jgi:transposase-like protein
MMKMICKYCQSDNIIKYGKYGNIQLYYCKACGKKFKDDDTTFHMKTDTNEVSSALNMYYEGMPIKPIRRHLLQELNHAPSTATIYEWIQKYTQYATDSIKDYHPNVGDIWICDETAIKMGGGDLWLWDIIDDKTRYLLATRLSRTRTTQDAQALIDRARKTAGKSPKAVVTDRLRAYQDVFYGRDAEHKEGGIARAGEDSTQKIERLHGTFKARTKIMRGLKNFETALDFTEGWLVHYNYLRPHESLQDKTPAEVAGIEYPYRNWADIIRKHQPSKPVIIEHQPRGIFVLKPTHIGRGHKHKRPSKRQTTMRPTTLSSIRVK